MMNEKTTCGFCDAEIPISINNETYNSEILDKTVKSMCKACFDKRSEDPESVEFTRSQEQEFFNAQVIGLKKNSHAHKLFGNSLIIPNIEANENYKELTNMPVKSSEILEARRDALRFAHETCHKLDHFSRVPVLHLAASSEEKQRILEEAKNVFISEIDEMHAIARMHMKFLMEG